ncbi:MAG: monofunctional biosynthetic peptidoglycan transglycosylase [Flavobacteriales bacterium]|nr:monofunctional biosynthetic peptidoglycan transglycosylase [Flavobacteriales bacterium]
MGQRKYIYFVKKLFRQIFLRIFKLLVTLVVFSVIWVLVYKYVNPPISGMMFYKWMSEENYTIKKEWKSLEAITPSLPLAIISAEDQKFLRHNGFDVDAIQKAIQQNKNSGRKRGASTISQQVAKNVFLFPTRSYLRKGLEVYFTSLIELIWGKRRIMEVYVNVVELGEGVYGVEAAAQSYFKKSANQLTKQEAALMATVLPNPLLFRLGKPSAYMVKRKHWVMRQMKNLGGERLTIHWYE